MDYFFLVQNISGNGYVTSVSCKYADALHDIDMTLKEHIMLKVILPWDKISKEPDFNMMEMLETYGDYIWNYGRMQDNNCVWEAVMSQEGVFKRYLTPKQFEYIKAKVD